MLDGVQDGPLLGILILTIPTVLLLWGLVRLRATSREARRLREECRALSSSALEKDRVLSRLREAERALIQQESACVMLREQRDSIAAELNAARTVAEEALHTKSLFVANMSHELRTPLNGIIGLARNLIDSGLSPRLQSEVELIQLAGEDLIRMVNDILDLSKLDASKVELERIPFHLGGLLEGAFGLLYPQAARKRLCCFLTYQPEVAHHYVGDPFRIRQVFLNLLSNALKFTDQGIVWVHAWMETTTGSEPCLYIRFEDTGVGIEEGKIGLIFDEFQQADLSTTRRFGGTGLGLSLSRRFVELMGGAITVESEPGRGSVFRATIPLAASKEGERIALDVLDGLHVLVQQRASTETDALLRLLDTIPGITYELVQSADGLGWRLADKTLQQPEVIITFPSAIEDWGDDLLQVLDVEGRLALPVILARYYLEGQEPVRPSHLRIVDFEAPFLTSHLIRILQHVRDIPRKPWDRREQHGERDLHAAEEPRDYVLVGHSNRIELMRLEGMIRKMGLRCQGASTTNGLSESVHAAQPAAIVMEGCLFGEDLREALARHAVSTQRSLRLLISGPLEPQASGGLGAGLVYVPISDRPRLTELREALHARPDPGLPI